MGAGIRDKGAARAKGLRGKSSVGWEEESEIGENAVGKKKRPM